MSDLNSRFAAFRRKKQRRRQREAKARDYARAEPIQDDEQFAREVLRHLGCKPQWLRSATSICLSGNNKVKIENVARLLTKTSPEYFSEPPAHIPRVERLSIKKRKELK